MLTLPSPGEVVLPFLKDLHLCTYKPADKEQEESFACTHLPLDMVGLLWICKLVLQWHIFVNSMVRSLDLMLPPGVKVTLEVTNEQVKAIPGKGLWPPYIIQGPGVRGLGIEQAYKPGCT